MSALLSEPALSAAEERFLAERRSGIGGADAGKIFGVSTYGSEYSVILDKRGEALPESDEEPEEREWGKLHEDQVARKYSRVTGRRVRRVGMLRHRDFPFVIGHPDRLVIGERRGLEIKTAGYWVGESDAWGEPGTDEIPAAYLLQCMHYMAITGYPVWDVAVLVAGNRYRPYTVQRDDELIAAMLTRYCQTWHCVQTGEIPPVSATAEEALLKYPVAQPTPIEASEDVARAARDYCAAKDLASVAEAEVKRTYPIIADYMGVNDTLTWRGVPVLTWKNRSTGNRLDVKAHAAARPDCHAKFTRSGQTRAMLRKGEIVL